MSFHDVVITGYNKMKNIFSVLLYKRMEESVITAQTLTQTTITPNSDNSLSDEEFIKKRGRPRNEQAAKVRDEQKTNVVSIKKLYRILTRKQKKQLIIDLMAHI